MYTRTAFVPQEVRAEAAVPVRTRRNGHLFPPQSWIRRRQFRSTGARGVQTLPVAFLGIIGHGCGLFVESSFSAAPEANPSVLARL